MSESILHWAYLFILSYALDFITYPILYYFIVLIVGCGTYTLIHIDHLDIRQIRVDDGNFIGIYLSLRKCKTPMYKLILNYAHMYATCSSRGWHAAHYIVVLFHFEVFYGFGIFTWNQFEIMTLNFQVSKYYQLIQTRDKFITRWNM